MATLGAEDKQCVRSRCYSGTGTVLLTRLHRRAEDFLGLPLHRSQLLLARRLERLQAALLRACVAWPRLSTGGRRVAGQSLSGTAASRATLRQDVLRRSSQ